MAQAVRERGATVRPIRSAPPTRKTPFFVSFYRSSLGKKYVMAITGLIFMLYVFLHMFGNLKMFYGPTDYNHYAENLRLILYPILPRGGYTPLSEDPAKWFVGLLTPWLVLGVYNCTQYARYSRGSMVETLNEDYIRTARAKGLSDRRVTYKHALRSGLIPVITIFGLDIAGALAGAIFTERIFDLPGLGNLVLQSLETYDLPVIMGTVLVASVVLVAMNFFVDVAYSIIDPRVRLS